MTITHATRHVRHPGEYVPLYPPRRRRPYKRVSDLLAVVAVVLLVSSAAGLMVLRHYADAQHLEAHRATAEATPEGDRLTPVNDGADVPVRQVLMN